MHTALRRSVDQPLFVTTVDDVMPRVEAEREKYSRARATICTKDELTGHTGRDDSPTVVNIGIGGSDLGIQ